MVHVIGKTIDLEDLRRVKMEIPQWVQNRIDRGWSTGTMWKPIPHAEVADVIIEEVERRKWKVLEAMFTLSDDKADMVAGFDLKVPGIKAPKGQTLSLGVLTSNAMRRPLKIVVGSTVTVCNNGLATGEIVLNRKHTLSFDLEEELRPALDEYYIKAQDISAMVEQMKGCQLSQEQADHILLKAARQGILSWRKINDVDEQYRNPMYPEYGRDTSWTLMNAFSLVIKQTAVMKQLERINSFRELLPLEVAA